MNSETLKQTSLKLRLIIDSLKAQDPAAMKLSVELEPLLKAADQERIRTPMEWRDIPDRYLLTEEGLQQYADLEHAFAEFRIELTGASHLPCASSRRVGGEAFSVYWLVTRVFPIYGQMWRLAPVIEVPYIAPWVTLLCVTLSHQAAESEWRLKMAVGASRINEPLPAVKASILPIYASPWASHPSKARRVTLPM